jgi:hypothetical protein
MTTCLALALATAAITACGGGSADPQSSITSSPTASDASASAQDESTTTTNVAAVAVATDTSASVLNESAAATAGVSVAATTDTPAANTVVASAESTASSAAVASSGGAAQAEVQSTSATSSNSTAGPAGPAVSAVAPRPAGNTGTGFYVVGNQLFDAKGKEFRIRGVNRTHYDNGSPGLPLSGANAERIVLNFTKAPTYNIGIVNSEMLAKKIVPMPGNWSGTCKADAASLASIVDTWVAQAPTWTALNSNGLINIANEWGPADSVLWRDSYLTAVARMRAAGYTGTLVIDTGGCGQNVQDVVKYGAAVLAADPQKNILFDVHVYGGWHYPATASWQQDYTKAMAQLKATGLAILVGEFGPGRNVGPSPTMVTPQQIIANSETNGFGWMAWAWDDNNMTGCMANDYWFSMTVKCGKYTTSTDLTTFGQAVVPIMQTTAVKASIF